jgi:hypothetical protein
MAVTRAYAIKQFTFNSVTYDATTGGPLDWDFDDSANEIRDRVADDVKPSAILFPEEDLMVSIAMREPYTAITKGTKSNLVVTVVFNSGSEKSYTFKDMVFLNQRGGGVKSTPAQSTVMFAYEGDNVAPIAVS